PGRAIVPLAARSLKLSVVSYAESSSMKPYSDMSHLLPVTRCLSATGGVGAFGALAGGAVSDGALGDATDGSGLGCAGCAAGFEGESAAGCGSGADCARAAGAKAASERTEMSSRCIGRYGDNGR